MFEKVLNNKVMLPLALLAWIFTLFYLFTFSLNFKIAGEYQDNIPAGDFLQFYVAGKIYLTGNIDRLYDFYFQDSFQRSPEVSPVRWNENSGLYYVYPPFFVLFCTLFAIMPYMLAAKIWVLVMSSLLIISIILLCNHSEYIRKFKYVAVLLILAYPPALLGIYSGQNSGLTTFLFCIVFLTLRKKQNFIAGLLAALILYKPQFVPIIFIAGILEKNWKMIFGFLFGSLALLLLSLSVGTVPTLEYFRLLPKLSSWIEMSGMPVNNLVCFYGLLRAFLPQLSLFYIQAITIFLSLISIYLVSLILKSHRLSSPFGFSCLIISALWLSPHTMFYDLTILSLVFIVAVDTTVARFKHGISRKMLVVD